MPHELLYITVAIIITVCCLFGLFFILWQQGKQKEELIITFNNINHLLEQKFSQIKEELLSKVHTQAQEAHDNQIQQLTLIQTTLREVLGHHAETLSNRVENLIQITDGKLQLISTQVDKRLHEGFEKTTATFTDIVKRLALIDDAQKKITELSTNVVSLQQILADKRSRGAFGEVQLKNLVENMLPAENVSFQHVLSNSTRCDCLLLLPDPTGNIAIDAKFPLENFYKLSAIEASSTDRQKANQLFKQDIKKHIQDIATKYIIPGETADGAIMFIPAEAIFAEIHSQFSDLVIFAQRQNVWLVSPTTMMAIVTTASAVLKDTATKKHINVIKIHLTHLAKDFARFDERMQKLTHHIDLAHDDVQQVNTSAKKISKRFQQIEQVQLTEQQDNLTTEALEVL